MESIDNLVEQLRRDSREVVRELGVVDDDSRYQLPFSMRHALIELNDYGALTQTELCTLLKLDKSTVSRLIQKCLKQGLIQESKGQADARFKSISLTASGLEECQRINSIADTQVNVALTMMTDDEKASITTGMALYASALRRARLLSEYTIRPIVQEDNPAIMKLIQRVLKEYGADRPGFAYADPELRDMYAAHSNEATCYFVIARAADNLILGGAGIVPLTGGDGKTCELVKMYLSSESRGLGLGRALLQKCAAAAQEMGYAQCYLETLASMGKANQLYLKEGFKQLNAPMGDTGHNGCDTWYLRSF